LKHNPFIPFFAYPDIAQVDDDETFNIYAYFDKQIFYISAKNTDSFKTGKIIFIKC